MECGDVKRPGIEGVERGYVINIDHHPGNVLYGALNWMDGRPPHAAKWCSIS